MRSGGLFAQGRVENTLDGFWPGDVSMETVENGYLNVNGEVCMLYLGKVVGCTGFVRHGWNPGGNISGGEVRVIAM